MLKINIAWNPRLKGNFLEKNPAWIQTHDPKITIENYLLIACSEMFFIDNFFSWQLFSEFLKFIQKPSLVQTLWSFQGVKKVYWKKSYSPFFVSQGKEGGEAAVYWQF